MRTVSIRGVIQGKGPFETFRLENRFCCIASLGERKFNEVYKSRTQMIYHDLKSWICAYLNVMDLSILCTILIDKSGTKKSFFIWFLEGLSNVKNYHLHQFHVNCSIVLSYCADLWLLFLLMNVALVRVKPENKSE